MSVFHNPAYRLVGGESQPAAVCKALENLPKDVDGTYDEAMIRINQQSEDDKELAVRVMSWVTLARRPYQLSVKFQPALAVTPTDPEATVDGETLILNAPKTLQMLRPTTCITYLSFDVFVRDSGDLGELESISEDNALRLLITGHRASRLAEMWY